MLLSFLGSRPRGTMSCRMQGIFCPYIRMYVSPYVRTRQAGASRPGPPGQGAPRLGEEYSLLHFCSKSIPSHLFLRKFSEAQNCYSMPSLSNRKRKSLFKICATRYMVTWADAKHSSFRPTRYTITWADASENTSHFARLVTRSHGHMLLKTLLILRDSVHDHMHGHLFLKTLFISKCSKIKVLSCVNCILLQCRNTTKLIPP